MQISYHIEQDKDSTGYIAYCPVMKPVSVYGKTKEEATEKLIDAIHLYAKKHPDVFDQIKTSSLEV